MAKGIIKSGAEIIYGYPGIPSTEVIQSLLPLSRELGIQIDIEWSINEKAFKITAGAAQANVEEALGTIIDKAIKKAGKSISILNKKDK